MKNTFTVEKFGDNWSEVVKQLKEKFSDVLESSDVAVVTGSPFLYNWSLSNCTFETNWVDSEGNEYVCCFDIDEALSSITVEGCKWTFNWKDNPSETVEIYKLNPIEPDLSEVGVQKDVVAEIVESAKLHGLYSACLSRDLKFMEIAGIYTAHVQHPNKDNDVSAWFEINNKRYPLVPRDNEQLVLSFWKKVGDDDPEEIFSTTLIQEEFDSLVSRVSD